VYHCRDVSNPDVVISFGLFDGSLEQLREAQSRLGRRSQVDRIAAHVEQVLLDGSYEVVEELVRHAETPPRRVSHAKGRGPGGMCP
jgi:hypothetical protein